MNPRRPGQFLEEQIQRKAMIAGVCIALAWGLALNGLVSFGVPSKVLPRFQPLPMSLTIC